MLERISSTRAEGEEAVSDLGAGMEQSSTSAIMEVREPIDGARIWDCRVPFKSVCA